MPSPGDSASQIKSDRARIYGRSDLSDDEKAQEYAIYSEALRRRKGKKGKKGAAHVDGAANLSHLTVVPLFRGRPKRDSSRRALVGASTYLRLLSIRNRLRRLSLVAGARAAWDESKHPRGQPGNPGQFAEVEGGGGGGKGDDAKAKAKADVRWDRGRNHAFNDRYDNDYRSRENPIDKRTYGGLEPYQIDLNTGRDQADLKRLLASERTVQVVRNAWNASPEHLRQHVDNLTILPRKPAGSGLYRYAGREVVMGIDEHPDVGGETGRALDFQVAHTLVHELGHAIWFANDYMTDDEKIEFGRAVFEAGGPLTSYTDTYSTSRLVRLHEVLGDGTLPVRSKKAEYAEQRKHSEGKWAVSMRKQGRESLRRTFDILGIDKAEAAGMDDGELIALVERKVGADEDVGIYGSARLWAQDPPESAVGEEAEARMRIHILDAHPTTDRIKLVSMSRQELRRKFIGSVVDDAVRVIKNYGPAAAKYERFLEREKKKAATAERKALTPRQQAKLDDEIAALTLSRRNKGADRYVSEAWAEATALYWGPENDRHATEIHGYNWDVWARLRPAYEKIMTRLREDGYRAKGDNRPSLAPQVSKGWQPATPKKPLKGARDARDNLPTATDAEFQELLDDLRSLASRRVIRTGRTSWSVYLDDAIVQVPDAADEDEAWQRAREIASDDDR